MLKVAKRLPGQDPHPIHQQAQGPTGHRFRTVKRKPVQTDHRETPRPLRRPTTRRIASPITAAEHALRLLAPRILTLRRRGQVPRDADHQSVTAAAPRLLDLFGIGPNSAATLLVIAGDPNTCTTPPPSPSSAEPVPSRHHQANQPTDTTEAETATPTPHSTTSSWAACDGTNPPTHDYRTRRLTEARPNPEIICCLKQQLGREVRAVLCRPPTHTTST